MTVNLWQLSKRTLLVERDPFSRYKVTDRDEEEIRGGGPPREGKSTLCFIMAAPLTIATLQRKC